MNFAISAAQKQRWWKQSGVIINDNTLDRSTRLFAVQFGHLWNLGRSPKGLEYSEREFGKMFDVKPSQVHLCLKRLEGAGYIEIKNARNRRKYYIPTEKLLSTDDRDSANSGEGLRQSTSSDADQSNKGTKPQGSSADGSPDYVLYDNQSEQTTCPPEYAELPHWKDIEQAISAKLKASKVGQSHLLSFKTHFEHHPIPLVDVLHVCETFSKALKSPKGIPSIDGYLYISFKNKEESARRSALQKQEEISMKKAKQSENYDKNVVSMNRANTELAYKLNTGDRLTPLDFNETSYKKLLNANKVLEDVLTGFVRKNGNVIFYTEKDKPYLFASTLYDIDALQRKQGVDIPGLEKLLETVE